MHEKRYNSELLNLGKRLKYFRDESGFTQLDIELKTGITRSDVSKIENGHKNIEFYTLIKLVVALEIEIHDLFSPELKIASKKTAKNK